MRKLIRKPSAASTIEAAAKQVAYNAAVRLKAQKLEQEAKESLEAALKEQGVTKYAFDTDIEGNKVSIKVDMVTRETTVVDVDKLAEKLTPDEFRACAKVSLTDARKVCSQSLIDSCSHTVAGTPYVSVKASGLNLN